MTLSTLLVPAVRSAHVIHEPSIRPNSPPVPRSSVVRVSDRGDSHFVFVSLSGLLFSHLTSTFYNHCSNLLLAHLAVACFFFFVFFLHSNSVTKFKWRVTSRNCVTQITLVAIPGWTHHWYGPQSSQVLVGYHPWHCQGRTDGYFNISQVSLQTRTWPYLGIRSTDANFWGHLVQQSKRHHKKNTAQ